MVNKKIQLDFTEEGLREKIEVVQGDTGRVLVCNIIGVDMTNVSARFYAVKKSGKEIYNNCTVSQNTVTIELTEQTLAEVGIVKCQLDLRKGDQKVQSFIFDIDVTASLMAQSEYLSSDEYKVVDDLADKVEKNENKIAELDDKKANKDDYGSPLKAKTVAEMTDKKKVYVYVGTETGYINGNWYTWEETAWVSGGVYNSAAIQTDKTLKQPDKAADSAIVGQQIGELKESKISKPSIDGTNGQVLSINEDGLLVWIDASGGTLDYRNVRNDESFTMDGTVNPSDGQYPQKGLEYEYTNLKNATTITNGRLLFNSSNDFTVFIAIKKEAAANIIDTGSTAKAFSFFINWDKNIYAQIRLTDNSAYPSMVYTPDNTSEMKYLAVTKNGDAYTLYYNGNSVRTMNSGGKQNIYSDDLVINQSEALINKMLIYNRCLTATEIKTTFSNIKKEVGE